MNHVWAALAEWAERLGVIGPDPDPIYSTLDNKNGLK